MKYELNEKQKEEYSLILESNEFDEKYYKKEYRLGRNTDPIAHFLKVGVNKGYNPSATFDTKFYLDYYKDVKDSGINPFVHYLRYGKNEHRIPKFLTSDEIEKLKISDDNIIDYLTILYSKQFDEEYYTKKYNLKKFKDPIAHFVEIGVHKGYNPSKFFDTKFYLDYYSDIKDSGINPFIHYLKYGVFMIVTPKIFTLNEIYNQNLNLTLKGKSDFLFLINDSNNEIKQHFDASYKNKFNKHDFQESYYFKKEIFNDNGIDYCFFDIPDKSIICKNFLPFEVNVIKRNVDTVDEILDFKDLLNISHYYKLDSHLNFEGGNILTFAILNYMDKKFKIKDWNNLLNEDSFMFQKQVPIDLLSVRNWSYSQMGRRILKNKVNNSFDSVLKPKELSLKKIPKKYSVYGHRESVYWKNPNSYSDKRALIFRDASFDTLKWFFSFYFREIFLCWDHGYVNDDIIKYFKPDVIIEARIERFIDNLPLPNWVKNKQDIFNI